MQADLLEPLVSSSQVPLATVDTSSSICGSIVAHADCAPGRLAISDGSISLSYGELEQRSNQLAAYLRTAGAGPERCVGLFLERSAEFVVAALAVLKTGAAYLPLDADTPAERAAYILGDALAALLVTHRGKARDLSAGAWRVVELDGPDAPRIASQPATPLGDAPSPDSLAYVVYTSGSTGRPKGVEITRANLQNLVEWHCGAFQVTAADRASQVAGVGFDAAAWEIWPHLAAGASLHIADEATRRSPQALRDWLVAERITISFVPTLLAEQLLHATWPAGTALRVLLTGADTLHRRPPAGLPFTLVNNYGPSECTVVATSGAVEPDEAEGGPPSIGRPIANTQVLILDYTLRPVPPGEGGEVCVVGAGVGRGYRNNPTLTAERFVSYVPEAGSSQRMYRTGDRARVRPDGTIAFLGRLDDQVKVRGYRIELGEVVAALDLHPRVEASAVVVRRGDDPSLVAYLVADQVTAPELRAFLAPRLPDYMIPARFVALGSLPVTANGKLDKAALPEPGPTNLLPDDRPAVELGGGGSDIEARIGTLVASLLDEPAVGREDNFFMLGGHSMLGVQILARIRDAFGVKLSLRQLFNAPTVAGLSAEVARLVEPVEG
ncbi:MAG: non-ribosomal peptide synthetase [Isosphaeraceae bacterium]|nr:non-ribosomal peptide synthetase [Isosphaeraceae bacterium]